MTVAAPGSLQPVQLRCEAIVNPVGIGTSTPRLSWKLRAVEKSARNLKQSGYRIQVGSEPDASDLWDSGSVSSAEMYGIPYSGKRLASGQKVWWRVQVVDQAGNASEWSKAATWSTGLLDTRDLRAE